MIGLRSSRRWVAFALTMACVGAAALGATPAQATPHSSKAVAIVNGRGAPDGGTLPTSGTVTGAGADDFSSFDFTTLDETSIDTTTLAAYDTVVLNEVFTGDLSAAEKQVLSNYIVAGGKLIIHDADGTTGNDYSWLPVPATTGVSCQNCGKTNGAATVVENNNLASADPASPFYVDVSEFSGQVDAIGDANLFSTTDPRWFIYLHAQNDLNVNGAVGAYASDVGLIIFNGFDTDTIGSALPSGNDWLSKLWYQELALTWDPDTLPHSIPVNSGGGGSVPGCGARSYKLGVVGVCADHIDANGSRLTASGNVTLDGGVSIGGPVTIDPSANQISSSTPVPVALTRPGGPVALGSFGFTIDANPVNDATSGVGNLAKVTLTSADFGALAGARVGGLPFALPNIPGTTLYLDGQSGGGLIGSAQIQVPFFGGLNPTGAVSLGFYATAQRVPIVLGGSLDLQSVKFSKGWSFDGLKLTYQQPTDTWTASGGLTIPFASLQASGTVVGGRLNSVSINVGNQQIPLFDSGFFFTDIGGSADGLAAGPLKLSASTAGFWGVPKAPVEPFYLKNVTFSLDFSGSASLDGEVKFVLKDKSPITGKLHLKVGLNPFHAVGNVVVDGSMPMVSLHVATGAGFSPKHFTMDGQGTLKFQGLAGTGEEVLSDAGFGATGSVCAHFPFGKMACQSVAFAMTWAKVHDLIDGKLEALGGVLGSDPRHLITVHASQAGSGAPLQVAAGQTFLTASATSPSGPPEVRLIDPHGKVYSSTSPAGNMLVSRQPEFNLTSVVIHNPVAGTWRVRSATGGPIQIQAQTLHPVRQIRTSPVAPASSRRHPLGPGQVVALRWSSSGLPSGVRVTVVDSPNPGQISLGRPLSTVSVQAGAVRVAVGRLSRGANYFGLVATLNGVPYQRLPFRGSAWRR